MNKLNPYVAFEMFRSLVLRTSACAMLGTPNKSNIRFCYVRNRNTKNAHSFICNLSIFHISEHRYYDLNHLLKDALVLLFEA